MLGPFGQGSSSNAIPRITTADVATLIPALVNLSHATGKLVIRFDSPKDLVRMIPPSPTIRFDHRVCYVVVGGLGGLG
jgi:hypothetical protein